MKTVKDFSYIFEKKEPALFVNADEIVRFDVNDCFSGMIKKTGDWPNDELMKCANPCTGPIYINGAEPGMTLAVKIIDLKIGNKGITIAKDWGMLKDRVSGIKIMEIEGQNLVVNDKIKIPVKPMLGCIATTPENPVSTLKSGYFGGNMDITFIRKGSIVYLPIFVPGGLLYIGDLHALQAESEPTLCGVETNGEVVVKVGLIPKKLLRPRIETENEFITVAIEKDMETATRTAVNDMFDFLTSEIGMGKMDAHVLISASCDVGLGGHAEVVGIAVLKKELIKNYTNTKEVKDHA